MLNKKHWTLEKHLLKQGIITKGPIIFTFAIFRFLKIDLFFFLNFSAATPLIMLLKDEVNPCKYIFRFADEMGFQGKKLRIMSMGDGQEDKARETIIECSTVKLIM